MIAQSAAVVVAAVIFTLIYDPFHVGALAFVALTPITLVFANPGLRCSLPLAGLFGFSFGLLASMAIVGPWMFGAATDYFGHGTLWALAFTLLVNAGYVGLFHVPAFVGIRLLAYTPPVIRIFGIASVWTTFEALRATDPAGNVWATLGQGFAGLPLVREAAAYGGEPLLGWAAALCGAAVGVGMQPDASHRNASAAMKLALAGPLMLALLGWVDSRREPDLAPLQPLRVAVVQAEIASRDVWDPAQRMAHWDAYVSATEALRPGTVDLVLWPESAIPFLLDADASARTKLAELARTLNAAILLGAARSEATGEGRANFFNSAFFFAPGVAEPLTYDKQRLLPFVEESPVASSGPAAEGEYRAGTGYALFEVRGWRIAPLLCFESVYPQYARAAVLGGANLLVNLSNDAWFSGGGGPEQHFAMSAMRTVELRRPMVRASNGGVSGALGPDGETIGIPIRRQKAVGVFEIPAPSRRLTLAATAPGLFPGLAGLLAALAVLFGLQRAWTRGTDDD